MTDVPATCAQCGAAYQRDDDSCAERFAALLALDHSRQEPWGSRHGSAFAVYTLQHPEGVSREALERCWVMLVPDHVAGDDAAYVARTLRQAKTAAVRPGMSRHCRPTAGTSRRSRVTIADLGDFDAEFVCRRSSRTGAGRRSNRLGQRRRLPSEPFLLNPVSCSPDTSAPILGRA